jgi:hypothetical protein
LDTLAKKFKEESIKAQEDGGFGPSEERKDGTMANFFDSNMQKLDRGGTMAKKMTARRQTKKVDGTMLSR